MKDDKMIEEVARFLCNCDSGSHPNEYAGWEDAASELIDLIQGSEWISVEDELPNIGSYISFVNNHDGNTPRIYMGEYVDICGNHNFQFNLYQDNYWGRGASPLLAQYVTHWMPLPSPPTNKGE